MGVGRVIIYISVEIKKQSIKENHSPLKGRYGYSRNIGIFRKSAQNMIYSKARLSKEIIEFNY